MRVSSSTIGMESARSYTSISARTSRMTITSGRLLTGVGAGALSGKGGDGNAKEEAAGTGGRENGNSGKTLNAAYQQMNARTSKFSSGGIRGTQAAAASEQLRKIRQRCINYLIELLFPERRIRPWEEELSASAWDNSRAQGASAQDGAFQGTASQGAHLPNGATQGKDAAGMREGQRIIPLNANIKTFSFSRQYYHEETENTGFATQGTVKCADGREINFNLNVTMSRSFQEYYEENVRMMEVSMCDPLVINLDGNIAELSDQTFLFDLDGDGQKDEINRLGAGSGFLALDKNGDGVINDGNELFGTKSGNGFADLAAYDTDHNGFIDEGDEIWDKLKIWVMDENGEGQLYSLAEKGVGAICLQNAATDFAITDENNQAKGRIRNTGFFLYENGEAGSVQHVDMTLHEQKEQEKIRQNQGKYEKWLYDMAM
ncbi:MAG: hypothetical protein HFI96_00120 [Lachnospiraceae bacterium]|nr:hypothetical protein [Lachnospiraceae bacterium]